MRADSLRLDRGRSRGSGTRRRSRGSRSSRHAQAVSGGVSPVMTSGDGSVLEPGGTCSAEPPSRGARWPKVMLVVGIVLYLAFGVIYAARSSATLSTPLGDGQYYEIMARQILTDHVYGYKSDRPNAYVTPGYPLFLAAVYGVTGHAEEGRPWPVLVALQLLFGAGAIALVYVLGSDLAGERAGAIAAFLFALYPPGFLIAPLWLTEPLGTVALLGYVVLQLRARERRSVPLALAAGAVLALAVLTRPAVLPVAVVPFALRAALGPREGLVRQAALALAAWALARLPAAAAVGGARHRRGGPSALKVRKACRRVTARMFARAGTKPGRPRRVTE
ncbi:MAG: hypothetical protein FDZ70_08335 [Actinobacteria bacterium]|nr:MAG: hypothetical protein FDZ70_08335 [Actinomycetota bacterium]